MYDSSRCLRRSKPFPSAPQDLVCPAKESNLTLAKNGNSRAHLGPFHTSTVRRGVNCTDLGETWLFLLPKVFLLLRCQEGCAPKTTTLKHDLGFLRPVLRQWQCGFLPSRVLGKRHFEKCCESPWLLSCVAPSTEFFSDRILSYKLVEKGDFPGSPVVKNPPCNVGDVGLIPGWGRSHMPQSN